MEVLYPRCAGLDVHAKSITACVRLAADGTITYDHYTTATTTRGLLALDAWLTDHGCTRVAMEATGVYWKPVWHVLEDHFTLVLANAMHIRNVPGRKSDANDARWVADLLAHGLIRSSFVPPARIQALRDLTRTRRQLGREVARHICPCGQYHQPLRRHRVAGGSHLDPHKKDVAELIREVSRDTSDASR